VRVRKFGHSCLLVEEGEDALLFDPGRREFLDERATPEGFAGVSVIVITHWHADHADPELIGRIVRRNAAAVVAPPGAGEELARAGVAGVIPAEGSVSRGGFTLEFVAAPHAPLLGGATPPTHVACVVNGGLLNPGDSFDRLLDRFRGVPAVALPVTAPWMTDLDAAAFVERLRPARLIPVHDGYVKDFFRARRNESLRAYFGRSDIDFDDLTDPSASVEL
jgi:L-ascorbate metabolism protein UlaG (beta-lactamase superfamily)